MNPAERMTIIIGSILISLACIAGAIVLYQDGQPEAATSLLALAGAGGIAALVARLASGGPQRAILLALTGALAISAAACGAVCDVYDAGHAASCALCDAARGSGAECEGPACAACAATSAPCPWREVEP